MVLRDVKPLDKKQWDRLQELMKRGSSKKQLQTIKESNQSLKDVNVEF